MHMQKNRLEAFSDGVIAIIITIMVLEMKAPHEATLVALLKLSPVFFSYVLSFIYIGIYWNNHHHLLHATSHVNGWALWANLHLLFWLSLIPFATAWMGENAFVDVTVLVYGIVLLMVGVAYLLLSRALVSQHWPYSPLGVAIGHDYKGKASLILYAVAIAMAYLLSELSLIIYMAVAAMWFVPDRRIARVLKNNGNGN